MTRTVYALFFFDERASSKKHYFYVGRSIDMFRRAKQHNYAMRKGHEDKYEFMRKLHADGIEWHVESLREIPDDEYPPDNERWFVIKLTRDGNSLMNMRYGSVERRQEIADQVQSARIRSVNDVRHDRLRRYEASKRLRHRILLSALKHEGVPNVLADTLLPSIIHKKLIAKGCNFIERGVTLAEIVRLIRAEPVFRRLRAKIPPST